MKPKLEVALGGLLKLIEHRVLFGSATAAADWQSHNAPV